MNIEKDIAKARRRPMDAAKMKELLVKLRKGATATLTFGKLIQVLDALGWTVEPVLGWTPMHYEFMGEEHLPSIDTEKVQGGLLNLERIRASMMSLQGNGEPDTPPRAVNEVAHADVGEIKKGGFDQSRPIWYFYYRQWVGTEGVTVTAPDGQQRTFLVDHHEVDRNIVNLADDHSISDLWRGLKEIGIADAINTTLGTEAHVPAAERTRENTGTCPACWGNYKLAKGKLVLHGYERPGHGYITGSCFCVGMEPIEVSSDGARRFREYLTEVLAREEKTLAKLESGEVEAIEGRRGKIFKKGEPQFATHLETAVHRAKSNIKLLKTDLETYAKVLAAWHVRPMPKEGELQRGIGFFMKE